VYFVTHDHLGDADIHGDLLDIFDIVRLARHEAWNTPVPFADKLAAAGAGSLRAAVARLLRSNGIPPIRMRVTHDDREAQLAFDDESTITIPRDWEGRLTDVVFSGGVADTLMASSVSLAAIAVADIGDRLPPNVVCAELENVRVNDVFYRREPHMMQRYSALALDNIRRAPLAFVSASPRRPWCRRRISSCSSSESCARGGAAIGGGCRCC
jgi:hypothetical protein